MAKQRSESLFRKDAIQALSKRPFGRPIAVMPGSWRWLTVFVILFAATSTLFLATAEYSRKESVRGWLVSSQGVARITHGTAGVVERIPLEAGQRVNVGDPVIYLSRDKFLEDGRSSDYQKIRELEKQIAAIDRRVELLRAEEAIQRESIATQLKGLDEQQAALARQRKDQRRRLDAAADKLSRLRNSAERGAASEWEVLSQEDDRAILEQRQAQLELSEIALDSDRARLRTRARTLPVETERAVASLLSERSQLRQKIAEQEYERRVVLKSPISGKLASIEVYAGGTVLPNQLLATVLPEDMTMVAEVYVPSSAVGLIREGQPVRLMYDAFPQQRFGTFAGEVTRISDFILMPTEVPQTFSLREATFKVQISIQGDSVALQTGAAPLRPGMLLAAEVVLESRRLIDWLLEPLHLRRLANT